MAPLGADLADTDHLDMYAACSGSVDMLVWLAELACTFTQHASEGAARAGHVHVVEWLRTHGHPWDGSALCDIAATTGNVQMLQYLKEHAAFSSDTLAAAAGAGQVHVCEFLLSERCPSDHRGCASAAAFGHCSTLRWLREHGCPMPAQIHVAAAESGSVEVMAYLRAEGLLADARKLTYMLNCTGAHNQLAAAQWLRAQGAEWPARLRYMGAMPWSLMALAWARAEGCRSPTTA